MLIILPISRTNFIKPVFESLEALERTKDTELLIVQDGYEKELTKAINDNLDILSYNLRIMNFDIYEADPKKLAKKIDEFCKMSKSKLVEEKDYAYHQAYVNLNREVLVDRYREVLRS